jgi:two-component system chemotaxis response regulator CheY
MARILVIDDEPGMLNALREMLESAGHQVVEAQDGAVAVRWWREHAHEQTIDLILTDILMPEKDGFEVIQEIRQLAPNTKVIAISGHSQVVKIPYLDVAKRLGAVRTIAKPFTMETLLNAVRAALDEDHSPGTVN